MTRPTRPTEEARAALRRVEERAARLGWPAHEAMTEDALAAMRAALTPRTRRGAPAVHHPGVDAMEAE